MEIAFNILLVIISLCLLNWGIKRKENNIVSKIADELEKRQQKRE